MMKKRNIYGNYLEGEKIEVKFIDGPLEDRILTLSDKTAKLVFEKQNNPGFEKDIVYTIRQVDGEWIGEMESK